MKHLVCTAILAFADSTFAASAHEFWIDAVAWQVAPDARIVAALRVGQAFEGSSMLYLPQRTRRFDLARNDAVAPVDARAGDRPALDVDAGESGLVTVIHATTDTQLIWDSWEAFTEFAAHKDADDAIRQHVAMGLPLEGVREVYSRYAKALVAVGDGAGMDRARGLTAEIVALENPYADPGAGLDVQVLYQGDPRAGAQVEVFDRAADGTVTVTRQSADAQGRATVAVSPGHVYMLDSVVLRQPGPDVDPGAGAMWESLWANLTFMVPEK